jgi:ribosomal protein S12 methylthiotransferase
MLAQQKVAFAKAKKMVGKTIEVLIDRPAGRGEEDGFVGRTAAQAPEIDSSVFVHGPDLHPGKMVDVKVIDFQAYDLVGEVPRKKGRSLAVVKA